MKEITQKPGSWPALDNFYKFLDEHTGDNLLEKAQEVETLLPPKYRFRFEVVTDDDEVIHLAEDVDLDTLIQKIGSIERDSKLLKN